MPMYEYTCNTCDHNDTLLEKINASKVKKCPECGKARAFKRMLSAPAFHLKGSGWYVTDFRGDTSKKDPDNQATNGKDASDKQNGSKESKPDAKQAKPDAKDKAKDKDKAAPKKPASQPASQDS